VEYKAVQDHLTNLREVVHPRGTLYERGIFQADDQVWEVGIAEIGAGNPGAAAEAERAIEYFDPRVIFFVGVAGGIKDVELGDVVTSTKIYGYESGKAKDQFLPRPSVGLASHALEQRARAEARKEDWIQRLGNDALVRRPNVFVGPIAAGEKVVASTRSAVYRFICTNYGDALAVEMEGRGFLHAAHISHPVQALVIRGISDLIDKKSEADAGGSQEIASRHASAFAFEILAKFSGGIGKVSVERKPDYATIPAPEPEFPVFEVPFRRNPNFTGREDILTTLHHHLNTERATVLTQAITGLGGVGKTQIAVEYAYRHADEYDLIWWVRAEEAAALTADYLALANELDLPVKTGADQTVFVNIVRHWLESTQRQWLLIFDNAERPDRLSEFLPTSSNGQILITSRNPNWRQLANVLPVAPFMPEEARQFLFKRTGAHDEAAADRLAELLGRLPLALAQAGAFIGERGIPLDAYSRLYKEQRQELWQREAAPPDYTATVTTTWELAFRQVKQSSLAAIALLNLCTFLAPDDIPLSILRDGVTYLPKELATAVTSPIELEDAVAALYQYSLIERKRDRLAIHRLVRDVAQERLGPERTQKWVEIAVSLIHHVFPFDKYDIETWPASARLLPHAFAVAEHAEAYQIAPAPAAALWQKTGEYLRQQGEYARAQVSIEHALAIRNRVLGKENVATAESLDYLGELQQEQANYAEAQAYHEQALKIRQADLGQEHADTAMSLNNLGALFEAQGEYEQAKPYFEEALAIRKRVLGDNHPDTALSLNNLGALLQVQGEYEQAKPYFEEALAICKRVLGDDHPSTARSLSNLGVLFDAQGEYEQARSYYEEALAIYKRVLGEDHPDTARSLNNLGALFQAQGEYEQARPYYEEALAIDKRVLGEDHPGTALNLNNLGSLLLTQGKYVAARPYLEQALGIYERVHGERHPHLVKILGNLGTIMFYLKQFVPVRRYLTRAAAICRDTEEQYAECQEVKQMLKALPGKIGRQRGKRKRRKKKRRR
jgi:tetratricopeptide (TPR) repeat protein/nucleoside phosphorylase